LRLAHKVPWEPDYRPYRAGQGGDSTPSGKGSPTTPLARATKKR